MIRNVLNNGRKTCQCLLNPLTRGAPSYNVDQVRTTVIVERIFPPLLAKKGGRVKMKMRNQVYKVVEVKRSKPAPPIECILTDYIEGIGGKGEVVTVKRKIFRNKLYPAGLAVYASPENLKEYKRPESEEKETKLTAFAQLTIRQLEHMYLRIPMSGDTEWTLNKTHLRVAFRRQGVELEESSLTLPPEPITGPQEVEIDVLINKAHSVKVKGCIYLVYKDRSRNVIPEMPPPYSSSRNNSETM